MIKQCKKCKRVLSGQDFHADAKSPDGKRSICKRCAIELAKQSKARGNEKSHGLIDVYYDILKRCYDRKSRSYPRYGGRGITMCDEWRNDRNSFVRWCIANGYAPGLQIDRIDNDKGYSSDNCRFVTPAENQHNTSQTSLSEKAVNIIRGNNVSRRKTQKQLAAELGVSQSRISEVCRNRSWKVKK